MERASIVESLLPDTKHTKDIGDLFYLGYFAGYLTKIKEGSAVVKKLGHRTFQRPGCFPPQAVPNSLVNQSSHSLPGLNFTYNYTISFPQTILDCLKNKSWITTLKKFIE